MKRKVKLFLRWAAAFILCFLVIYLIVFFGGYQLFASGDPVLMELGAALVLSIFLFAIDKTVTKLKKRVKSLEERLSKLENINESWVTDDKI